MGTILVWLFSISESQALPTPAANLDSLMKKHACDPNTNVFIQYFSDNISLGSVSFVILCTLSNAFILGYAPEKGHIGCARLQRGPWHKGTVE